MSIGTETKANMKHNSFGCNRYNRDEPTERVFLFMVKRNYFYQLVRRFSHLKIEFPVSIASTLPMEFLNLRL